MEGPSLVIAVEELSAFRRKKVTRARGSAELPYEDLEGSTFLKAKSWGKHLLLFFSKTQMRIHFLMFGSYRIDDPRPQRTPKLELEVGGRSIFFYSCAIKAQAKGFEKAYDESVDLMSAKWDPRKAVKALSAKEGSMVCDVLMDQQIFSGLGNIMKNEILYNLSMHPETKIKDLSPARRRKLVKEAEAYAWRFYEWKKENVLKRNWKIMRKKLCPHCGGKVRKKATGRLVRWSFFCPRRQKKS